MKIIKVTNCTDCKHFAGANMIVRINRCLEKLRRIESPFEIPEWCPLEEVKE